ncbi:vang-like protein 2 [Dinothrombium tinctorium]|uniref:Vang-like protein 2 n=1 Tax=Dinothrombium tinctorium TaxID=1965070 RepID=A0A443R7P6_9ACAR|nr:vang-like protein 2 [Dinothrombium tinctorium]
MGSTSIPPSLWSNDIHHSPSIASSIQLPTFKVQMDTESVRSGHSERSRRGRAHNTHNVSHSNSNHVISNTNFNQYNTGYNNHVNNNQHDISSNNRSMSRHSHRSARSDRFGNKIQSPYERHERRRDEEVIEVQILPQDDNWADNTTAITGNTSDHSISIETDMNKVGKEPFWSEHSLAFRCQMWTGTVVASFLSFCAFISPIIMVILPKIENLEWKVQECGPECDGLLISFSFKLLILLLGTWALFFRKPRATMPRIFIYRSVVLALIFVFMVSYWLFYAVRIAERRFSEYELSYHSIVLFAVSLVDALLFIHYLAVILIELRHLTPQFFVKVVRSPDGESHCYNIGELSIQRASVWILEHYYKDFSVYNPYLDLIPRKKSKSSTSIVNTPSNMIGNHISSPPSTLKYYDVDGVTANSSGFSGGLLGQTSAAFANVNENGTFSSNNLEERSSRRGKGSSHHHHHHHHNDRFHEEHEYERRVKKRKARLMTAVEDAFTHIKRVDEEQGAPIPMDPYEAAQAIFPSFARTLQKYLRITRQQPRHSMQSIINHLAMCLSFDLSPKAFVEKYIKSSPVLQNDKEHQKTQTWGLICDVLLSRTIENGTVFMLRQGDVSLLVTVHSIPHFNITEEIIDPKSNKFVFRLNSETSV